MEDSLSLHSPPELPTAPNEIAMASSSVDENGTIVSFGEPEHNHHHHHYHDQARYVMEEENEVDAEQGVVATATRGDVAKEEEEKNDKEDDGEREVFVQEHPLLSPAATASSSSSRRVFEEDSVMVVVVASSEPEEDHGPIILPPIRRQLSTSSSRRLSRKASSRRSTLKNSTATSYNHKAAAAPVATWPDGSTKYRQWLYDRVDGTSRYNGSWGRPFMSLCWVPVPVRWIPDWMEQNRVMERFGRIGCVNPENPQLRRYIFMVALCCNFASLTLTFLASLAMTHENFDLLQTVSFTRGTFDAEPHHDDNETNSAAMSSSLPPRSQVDIGLRTVALSIGSATSDETEQRILHFDEFCNEFVKDSSDSFKSIFMTPEQCAQCSNASFPIIFSLVVGMIFTFPSITTNFLRMWPNYDVNCQKFFGAVVGTISLLSSCYSWYTYTNDCFNNFDDGFVALAQGANDSSVPATFNLTLADTTNIFSTPNDTEQQFPNDNNDDDAATSFVFLQRVWTAGVGLKFVVAATLLKGVDSVCNWMIPTPSITRDHHEQRAYEFLAAQGQTHSAFARLQQKHRAREVHTGLELRPHQNRHLGQRTPSLKRLHRLLGIPDHSHRKLPISSTQDEQQQQNDGPSSDWTADDPSDEQLPNHYGGSTNPIHQHGRHPSIIMEDGEEDDEGMDESTRSTWTARLVEL